MKIRTCRVCKLNKSINQFDKDTSRTDQISSRCKDCRRNYHNEHNDKNRDKKNESSRKYYYRTHEKQIKRIREKYNNDKRYSVEINVRNRLKLFLKTKNIKKKTKTFEIIGCTPDELRVYLEKKFKEGMSWENYGFYGWHIDHIIPLSFAKTEDEIYKLSHYTNLQPLWCNENWKKLKKYE